MTDSNSRQILSHLSDEDFADRERELAGVCALARTGGGSYTSGAGIAGVASMPQRVAELGVRRGIVGFQT